MKNAQQADFTKHSVKIKINIKITWLTFILSFIATKFRQKYVLEKVNDIKEMKYKTKIAKLKSLYTIQ